MKFFYSKMFFAISITVSLSILAVNCKKDKINEDPPQLPPKTSMVMDFSDFSSATIDYTKNIDSTSYANHNWAGLNVGVWNLILTVRLAIPVASFYEAFNHQYVEEGDNLWSWSYSFVAQNTNHTAKLTAMYIESNQKIQWDMFITKDNVYSNFHWYTGYSAISGLEGNWTLNESNIKPTPLLSIDWHRNTSTGSSDIKYTNVAPGGIENGGYIYYAVSPGASLDATYDIFNKGENNLINIQWNKNSKNGRIKDAKHYLNPDWHCWDSSFLDCNCP